MKTVNALLLSSIFLPASCLMVCEPSTAKAAEEDQEPRASFDSLRSKAGYLPERFRAFGEDESCVFDEAREVTLTIKPVSGRDEGVLACSVRDYYGRVLASPRVSFRGDCYSLPLGRPPIGYYELSFPMPGDSPPVHRTISFAVIPDNRAIANESICVDSAMAWTVPPEYVDLVCKMARRAGITWVRDRIAWRAVQPERDRFDFQARYATGSCNDATYAAERKYGLKVSATCHDTPPWARGNQKGPNPLPENLFDVYRFFNTVAKRWQYESWEIWNEMDLPEFSSDTGLHMAAVTKAASLGIKHAMPRAIVQPTSFAYIGTNVKAMARNLIQNDLALYVDTYNYHCYKDTAGQPGFADFHKRVIEENNTTPKQIWLTEGGFRNVEAEGFPHFDNQKRQADFLVKLFMSAAANGVTKAFEFILYHFVEGSGQWGMTTRDCKPYPAYVTLALLINKVGGLPYVGSFQRDGLRVFCFAKPDGTLSAVAWEDIPFDLSVNVVLPIRSDSFRVTDLNGVRLPSKARNDRDVEFPVSGCAEFLEGLPSSIKASLTPAATFPATGSENLSDFDREVVGEAQFDAPVEESKETMAFVVTPGQTITGSVTYYNFSDREKCLTVNLASDEPWPSQGFPGSVTLKPWATAKANYQLRSPDTIKAPLVNLKIVGTTGEGKKIPATYVPLTYPESLLPLAASKQWNIDRELATLDRWQTRNVFPGTLDLRAEKDCLGFAVQFRGGGDIFVYPAFTFATPVDLSAYNAVVFDLHLSRTDPDSTFRVMLSKANSHVYFNNAGKDMKQGWRRVVVRFADLTHAVWVAESDPDGRLTLEAITQIRFGFNKAGGDMEPLTFKIKGVRFVYLD